MGAQAVAFRLDGSPPLTEQTLNGLAVNFIPPLFVVEDLTLYDRYGL